MAERTLLAVLVVQEPAEAATEEERGRAAAAWAFARSLAGVIRRREVAGMFDRVQLGVVGYGRRVRFVPVEELLRNSEARAAAADEKHAGGDESERSRSGRREAESVAGEAFRACAEFVAERSDWCRGGMVPVVIHVAGGGLRGAKEAEQWASRLRTLFEETGRPGRFWNVLLSPRVACALPAPDEVAGLKDSEVSALFRMSSPLGEGGSARFAEWGWGRAGSARCLAAGPWCHPGVVWEFILRSLPAADGRAEVCCGPPLVSRAFVEPKEGSSVDTTDDALLAGSQGRVFCVCDGASAASYAAEWARSVTFRVAESPPPRLGSGEKTEGRGSLLRRWIEPAVGYWDAEVPWERLTDPLVLNKARRGAGATIAGAEFSAGPARGNDGPVHFRGWALGDACVFHLRGGRVVSAHPCADSSDFGLAPPMLLTWGDADARMAGSWIEWDGEAQAGDVLVLATDALSKMAYVAFERGGAGELLDWFDDLLTYPPGQARRLFRDFVLAKRADGTLENDDVALVLVRVCEESAGDGLSPLAAMTRERWGR